MAAVQQLNLYNELATWENFAHAVAGMTGGVIAITTFYPLNNIRMRLQVDESIKPGSMLSVAQQIVDKYGAPALFQGWWSSVVSLGASNFVYFYTYNALKIAYQVLVLGDRKKKVDPVPNLAVAAVAGVINVFATTPLWVAGTRLSVQDAPKANKGGDASAAPAAPKTGRDAPYKGVWDCLVRITNEEGFLSLWKGVGPSLLLVSNPSIQFVTYERLRIPLENYAKANKQPITALQFFVIGAIAKAVATVVTYPVQLAQGKLRHSRADDKGASTSILASTLRVLNDVYAKDGAVGLFKGMEAKLWQTVLTAALQFTVMEKVDALVLGFLMGDKGKQIRGGH